MRPMSQTTGFERTVTDRDLAARYWAARGELRDLRHSASDGAAARNDMQVARAFQRIRELDSLCDRLWREGCRRAGAGSLAGVA